jgi:membrane complex biogenesis BtpA family protein
MRAFDGISKPLVAMIHLPPLPGSANYDGRPVREMARVAADEARLLEAAGFDGVMIQNTHDRPARVTVPAGTTAAIAAVTTSVRDAVSFDVGVNVHKNDAEAALAVAAACGASFVRIKVLVGAVVGPEGIIQGAAERALDVRRSFAPQIEIWADLYELTSWPLAPTGLANLADLATRFGGAERLIVTDPTVEDSRSAVVTVRAASPAPVIIGGRTNADNIAAAMDTADGVIVGTCLRHSARTDQPLDPSAVHEFMRAARTPATG